jgi:hypothetical protein
LTPEKHIAEYGYVVIEPDRVATLGAGGAGVDNRLGFRQTVYADIQKATDAKPPRKDQDFDKTIVDVHTCRLLEIVVNVFKMCMDRHLNVFSTLGRIYKKIKIDIVKG